MECGNVMAVGSHSKVTQRGSGLGVLIWRGRMFCTVKGDRVSNMVKWASMFHVIKCGCIFHCYIKCGCKWNITV